MEKKGFWLLRAKNFQELVKTERGKIVYTDLPNIVKVLMWSLFGNVAEVSRVI